MAGVTGGDSVPSIKNKAQLLQSWRAELGAMKKLAAENFYIRVLGSGYRLISISPKNPCGRLLRKGTEAVIGRSSTMAAAMKSAETAKVAESYDPQTKNKKPEHRMQAAMIQYALLNNLRLHGMFDGFGDVFDELFFVADELAAEVSGKKIRADIIALGGIRGEYFPVFIELKAHRALGRLIQQLRDAKDAMNEAGDDFALLLSSATGKATQNIHIDRAQMLIVWTESQTGQERGAVSEARSAGFILSTFGSPPARIVRSHGEQ